MRLARSIVDMIEKERRRDGWDLVTTPDRVLSVFEKSTLLAHCTSCGSNYPANERWDNQHGVETYEDWCHAEVDRMGTGQVSYHAGLCWVEREA